MQNNFDKLRQIINRRNILKPIFGKNNVVTFRGQVNKFAEPGFVKLELRDKYGTVGNWKTAFDFYDPIILRLDKLDRGKLSEIGNSNLDNVYNFIINGGRVLSGERGANTTEGELRVIPSNNDYVKLVLDNIDKISDEDVYTLLNTKYRVNSFGSAVDLGKQLLPVMKKVGLGLTDFPSLIKTGKQWWKDPNITFSNGGYVGQQPKSNFYADGGGVNKFDGESGSSFVETDKPDTWNTPMYKVPFSDMNGGVPIYIPATEGTDKVAEYNPWMEKTTVGGMTDDVMGKLMAVPGANMLASAYFAGRGVQGLVADNGVKKTKNLIGDWWDALKQGDMQKANELQHQAGWSALGDIANTAMVVGGVPVARKIAENVGRVGSSEPLITRGTPNITAENAASITPEVTLFYHGSPVRFDAFSADFIGSGEGGSKVMRGINLWPKEKIGNAPKFANIKSPDAPLHLGVSSTPLGGELNPTVYDVSGKGLKLYKATPREIKSLNQEDLIKQGYDGVQTTNQVTVFPESLNKLSIDKQSSIEDFVMNHPEVERWTPWTTDNQKMQNIIDMSKMSKWTPEQWTAAQDAAGVLESEVGNTASKLATGKGYMDNAAEGVEQLTGYNPNNNPLTSMVFNAMDPLYFTPYSKVKQAFEVVGKGVKGAVSDIKNIMPKLFEPYSLEMNNGNELVVGNPKYNIKTYPGYQLKSLMRGNPLEKQLSKDGTISINSIKAQAAKGSNVEKEVINKVLSSEQFIGLKSIDYNTFRKAVLDELITYNRVPSRNYESYGIDRLGFNSVEDLLRENNYRDLEKKLLEKYPEEYYFEPNWGPRGQVVNKETGRVVTEDELARRLLIGSPEPKLNTFTFESPRIPRGNDKHYDSTTLGHSRTYTTAKEPDVLHVMESQSDWAQETKDLTPRFSYNRAENGNTNILFDENGQFYFTGKGEGMPYKEFMNLDLPRGKMPFEIAKGQFQTSYPVLLVKHLHDNYLQRQIQENLKYAAENGLTRMRYPTSETAAKIEGYEKTENTPEYLKALDELDRLSVQDGDLPSVPDEIDPFNNETIYYTPEKREQLIKEIKKKLEDLRKAGKDRTYSSQYQTILKKYSDFQEQYQKLFGKNVEVRTITDNKGNSWYEVDVPENYLQKELLYSNGGPVNKFDGGGYTDSDLSTVNERLKNFSLKAPEREPLPPMLSSINDFSDLNQSLLNSIATKQKQIDAVDIAKEYGVRNTEMFNINDVIDLNIKNDYLVRFNKQHPEIDLTLLNNSLRNFPIFKDTSVLQRDGKDGVHVETGGDSSKNQFVILPESDVVEKRTMDGSFYSYPEKNATAYHEILGHGARGLGVGTDKGTYYEEKTISQAYPLITKEDGIAEAYASNTQLRSYLQKAAKLYGKDFDSYIDNMSDEDLYNAMMAVGGYFNNPQTRLIQGEGYFPPGIEEKIMELEKERESTRRAVSSLKNNEYVGWEKEDLEKELKDLKEFLKESYGDDEFRKYRKIRDVLDYLYGKDKNFKYPNTQVEQLQKINEDLTKRIYELDKQIKYDYNKKQLYLIRKALKDVAINNNNNINVNYAANGGPVSKNHKKLLPELSTIEYKSKDDDVLKEKPQQEVHEVLLDENGKMRTHLTKELIGKIEKEAAYNKMMKDAGFDPVTGDRITPTKNTFIP